MASFEPISPSGTVGIQCDHRDRCTDSVLQLFTIRLSAAVVYGPIRLLRIYSCVQCGNRAEMSIFMSGVKCHRRITSNNCNDSFQQITSELRCNCVNTTWVEAGDLLEHN